MSNNNRKRVWYIVIVFIFVLFTQGCRNAERTADTKAVCRITQLTVNYEKNPIGIEQAPLFGWCMESETAGQCQTAYRIVVSERAGYTENKAYVWDSGRVESGISVAVPYGGETLKSETEYVWKVYVWDKDGNQLESSEEARFETGLSGDEWSGACWIGIREPEPADSDENVHYRAAYDVKLGRTYSGFCWGMDTNQYGEYLRCTFNTLGNDVVLTVSEFSDEENDSYSVVLNQVFPDEFGDVETFCNGEHHMVLEVEGSSVCVDVDGVRVMETHVRKGRDVENVGFWTERGKYYAFYDNIHIVDLTDEKIVWEEDFHSGESNIFSPHYVRVVDGWCEASSGFILTPGVEEPAPMLRRSFVSASDTRVLSARLYATALGDYRIYFNGRDICGEYLTPGRSIYDRETFYRTYDITEFVKAENAEENVIGVILGHGRYDKSNADWGDQIAFQAKLVIQYEDGKCQTIVTDTEWQVYDDGPVRNDDMYLGEYYDATREQAGWLDGNYAAEHWRSADLFPEYDVLSKRAAETTAVKQIDTLMPVSVSEPVQGAYVYDFGQNFNGNCQIILRDTENKEGQVITIRYAEALNHENLSGCDDEVGTIFTENLYTADNTDYYVLSGSGEEIYTPSLVCRGFRYVQISGTDEAIPVEDVSGLVISSDNQRTGSFVCSDEKINKLYNSIYWTQLSNYLDVPTDCPQRDERFGWAGDAQVFARTASYNSNVHSYLKKYVEMLIGCQDENGAFPEIVPDANADSGANGWSDAGIIMVWELYQQYGDTELIRRNLDAMCKYMDYLVDTSEGFIRTKQGYSDHNAVSMLDNEIANTAQCAYAAKLLSKMSADIGEEAIADRYDMVFNQYKKAWQDQYINADGSIDCWLQSAYTLGLAYDLYPQELKAKGAACLNNAVAENAYHLNTGYIATQFLLPVLCEYGYVDTAYRILQQDTYPSWNDMLSRDQTTLTESWFTCLETDDGMYTVNGSMNHLGLGSVGQWFYSDILGIRRDEKNPGYKHFYLEPQIGGGLQYVSGSYESVYGTIESSWQVEGNEIVFQFVIPANTTASVTLPDEQYQNMELVSGRYEYRVDLNR